MNNGDGPNETNDLSRLEEKTRPKKKSTGTKVLIGCGIGCAGMMFLLFITCIGSIFYMRASSTELPDSAMLSEKTILFGKMEVDPADDGVASLLQAFQKYQRDNDFKNVPNELKSLLENIQEGQEEQQIEGLRSWVDFKVLVVLEERDGTVPQPTVDEATEQGAGPEQKVKHNFIVVFSLRRSANLARFVWGLAAGAAADKNGEVYAGVTLIRDGKDKSVFGLVDNNFFVASSVGMAKKAVDRLLAAQNNAPVESTDEMAQAVDLADSNSDVMVALADETTLESVIISLDDKQKENKVEPSAVAEAVLGTPLSNIAFVIADGDIVSAQKIVFNVLLSTRDKTKAEELLPRLRYLLTALENSDGFIRTGMVMLHEESESESGVEIKIELNRFWDWLEQNLDRDDRDGMTGVQPPDAEATDVNDFLEPVQSDPIPQEEEVVPPEKQDEF